MSLGLSKRTKNAFTSVRHDLISLLRAYLSETLFLVVMRSLSLKQVCNTIQHVLFLPVDKNHIYMVMEHIGNR
jgi:hypothetical protein